MKAAAPQLIWNGLGAEGLHYRRERSVQLPLRRPISAQGKLYL